jgi:lysophospholipase L1-like esterase
MSIRSWAWGNAGRIVKRRLAQLAACAGVVSMGCNGSSSEGTLGDGGVPAATDGAPSSSGGASSGGARNGTGTGATTSSGGASGSSSGSSSGGAGGSAPASGGASTGTGGSTASSGGRTNASDAGDGGAEGGITGPATVRIVGRTHGDPSSPSFEWSGVSIQARFKGTSVTMDVNGGNNNYFEVVVDGQIQPLIAGSSGRKMVPVVAGLTSAEHDLTIWRRTEADNYTPTQFYGLDIGGGALLAPAVPSHKVEVIGDSITCGYGDEGNGPNCSFSFDTENSYLAYGSVAARELDADLYTECWSGKGMYRNGDGSTDQTLPALYPLSIPTDTSTTWDFSWKPDAVVVDLGTNDFATGDPGQPYVNAYESFVTNLRGHYPNAYIFVVIGPMLTGDSLTEAQTYLDQVVKARHDAGDPRIQQISVDPQDSANGLGCDYHPTVKTHSIMGKAFAAAMKGPLGW